MKKSAPHVVAFLTVAIDLLGFGIVLPLLPIYAEHLLGGIPAALHGLTIGGLMASFSLMQFLFSPAWGRLSDRIGRRPVLMVGLIGSVVFYALFGLATAEQSLLLLFVSRCGAGVAGATIGTAQAVIADCTPPEKRARGMALIGMAFGIGFTLGPVIGAFWVSDDLAAPPSPAPGYVAAVLSFLALLFAFFRLPETLSTSSAARSDWLNRQSWGLAFSSRALALPVLTFFTATFAFGCFESTLARLTKDVLQYPPRTLFYLFALVGVVLALTQGLLVRRLVPRLGEVAMTFIGTLCMVLGMFGLGHGTSIFPEHADGAVNLGQVLIMGSVVIAVVGFAFVTPSVQALVSRRCSAERQGEILGVNQAASAIARILGPMLGNILYNASDLLGAGTRSDSFAWPFYASAGLMLLAMLMSTALRTPAEAR
jgi:MFS family permease